MKIGEKTAARLKELNRSQRWLAKEVGVSPTAIAQIIKGGGTSDAIALKIARSLDVPVDWLADDSRGQMDESVPKYSFPLVEDFPNVGALRRRIARGGNPQELADFDRLCSDLAMRKLMELADLFQKKAALDAVSNKGDFTESQRSHGVYLQDRLVELQREIEALGAGNLVPETIRMHTVHYADFYKKGPYVIAGPEIAGMTEHRARQLLQASSLGFTTIEGAMVPGEGQPVAPAEPLAKRGRNPKKRKR